MRSGWLPACLASVCLLAGCSTDLVLPPGAATLTVAGGGAGSGIVAASSATPQLECPIIEGSADETACRAVYPAGTAVTLSADAAPGSVFSGWAGGCSGVSACAVTLADSARVVATFDVATYTITVVGAGTGSGTVKSPANSTPAISCTITGGRSGPSGCGGQFVLSGNRLTLTASAASGSTFSGWGGDCTGTTGCSVALDGDRVVSAAFVPRSGHVIVP